MRDKYCGTTMNTMGHTNQSLVLSHIGNPIEGMMDVRCEVDKSHMKTLVYK